MKKDKNLIYGVGFNDVYKDKQSKAHKAWLSMLNRCYVSHQKYPSYLDCNVCEEWLTFSNFKRWFEDPANGYKEGYHLDKDILFKGNKIYSPQTCCFVPLRINLLVCKGNHIPGKNPKGVLKCESGRYRAIYKTKCLGRFDTLEEAFSEYKKCRESDIKRIAKEAYENEYISLRVYQALLNYKVEITD